MHPPKNGGQWYFETKAHIGVEKCHDHKEADTFWITAMKSGKVRYWWLAMNTAQLITLFTRSIFWVAHKKPLQQIAA